MISDRDQRILDKTRDTDEPTIVFRAQDRTTVELLTYYLRITEEAGVDPAFLRRVERTRSEFVAWQAYHGDRVKTPDLSPEDLETDGDA